jgi:hypothetical protein
MLHAAAVTRDGRALLFPAESGSGKSTLAAFLVSRGFGHMSDELVHLSERDHQMHGWMRPIELKHGSAALVAALLLRPTTPTTWLDTPRGCILAPELLSLQVTSSVASAAPAAVVFPRFTAGRAAPELRPISPAQTSAGLLRWTLNARHLPGHGLPTAAAWARRVPGFELAYGSFDALDDVLAAPLASPRLSLEAEP